MRGGYRKTSSKGGYPRGRLIYPVTFPEGERLKYVTVTLKPEEAQPILEFASRSEISVAEAIRQLCLSGELRLKEAGLWPT